VPNGPALSPSGPELDQQLRSLTTGPARGAVFCDIDGTLALIVERPNEARVPAGVSGLLKSLTASYACVACVSGRPALEARRLVGVGAIAYAGLHGAELLLPGQHQPSLAPSLEGWRSAVQGFTAVHSRWAEALGARVEDKGPVAAFHWRGVADEEAALRHLRSVADAANEAGLSARWGRKVLEVWPPVNIGKGQAVGALVRASRARVALYGGDDATDLDAFDALDTLVAKGDLDAAVRVGVRSEEAPGDIVTRADIVVEGVEGFKHVLKRLLA